MIHSDFFTYTIDNKSYKGFIASDTQIIQPRPGVLIIHDWAGCHQYMRNKAIELAHNGYVGFAIDMYGNGDCFDSIEDRLAAMTPLINDRDELLKRVMGAFLAFNSLPEVNEHKIAAMGYCFGGLCAFDLARSGADFKGAIGFHASLIPRPQEFCTPMRAKILALHGYDDPLVSPTDVNNFANEMTKRQADYQIHMYGHTMHSFTNPEANDYINGTVYDETAAKRSLIASNNFLDELFNQ